jgi:hypothetical protein
MTGQQRAEHVLLLLLLLLVLSYPQRPAASMWHAPI